MEGLYTVSVYMKSGYETKKEFIWAKIMIHISLSLTYQQLVSASAYYGTYTVDCIQLFWVHLGYTKLS